MLNYWQIGLVLVSTIIIGIADAFIKKVSSTGSFSMALRDPLLLLPFFIFYPDSDDSLYFFPQRRPGDLWQHFYYFLFSYNSSSWATRFQRTCLTGPNFGYNPGPGWSGINKQELAGL